MKLFHRNNNTEAAPSTASTNTATDANAHANTSASCGGSAASAASGSGGSPQRRRRLSLFSFGHGSLSAPPSAGAAISTSPSNVSTLHSHSSGKLPLMKSLSASFSPLRQNELVSPTISPVLEADSLSENPDSHIFERSVQDMAGLVKQEDYISPALDATALILSDSATDLYDIDIVYSSRRHSSVIGLNIALGRPYTPLRKNSIYSVSHVGNNNANNSADLASLSSLSYLQPHSSGGPGNLHSSMQLTLGHTQGPGQQMQSPVSPPKLMSSRSSVSFYSYADMINNDEFSRRPSLMQAYNHGVIPPLGHKLSVTSNPPSCCARNCADFSKFPRKTPQPVVSPSESHSQLSKHFKDRLKLSQVLPETAEAPGEESTLNKFLISPESSDSENQDEVFHPASSTQRRPFSRRKSVASNTSFANSAIDNDSFVYCSVGDCIRRCTTEIENN